MSFLSVHVLIGAESGDSGGEADVSSIDAVEGVRGGGGGEASKRRKVGERETATAARLNCEQRGEKKQTLTSH